MATVQIKGLKIGEGKVKICVPIIKGTMSEIQREVLELDKDSIDIVEWRIDYFEDCEDKEALLSILSYMKAHLKKQLLLVSFRNACEGGNREVSLDEYKRLLYIAIASGCVDIVDVELFSGEEVVKDVVAYAHQHSVFVIGSNHDFIRTPSYEDMKQRLFQMAQFGCDIAKIAVMPNTKDDVLTLLKLSADVHFANVCPIVTMSMGEIGVITRICGEFFGSCISFATHDEASAPGQLPLRDMDRILSSIHSAIGCK